jgi:hypothetical protein
MRFFRPVIMSLLFCLVLPFMSNADQLEDANTAIENKDYRKAFKLFQPLAEEGNAEAQTRLGALYVNGQGVEQDLTKGLSWIMKAAAQGYETARKIAFKLCLDLVNQGDTTVMYNLGNMCLNGWGGEYNPDVCLGWLENAGKIGHEKSSNMLAKIYTEGTYGMTPDEEKATYWSNLSAAFAFGIDGEWEGSIPMPVGHQPMIQRYEFKTKGHKLTGTTALYSGPTIRDDVAVGVVGQKIRIRDGKIEGNKFSFTVKGMKNTNNYTGTFLGDRLKLTYTTKARGRRTTGSGISRDTGGGDPPPVTFIARRVE